MAFENSSGLGIYNHYGPRDVGGTVGVEQSSDGVHQLSITFTGDSLNEPFISPYKMLQGAHVLRTILRVDQAFALTGTTPTVQFGSTGSVATNGIALTAAELGAIGTKLPADQGKGTWSPTSTTGLTSNDRVAVLLGGTTPAVTKGVGKGTLLVEFVYKTKNQLQ